jgi:SAM-dependent methyltransferase
VNGLRTVEPGSFRDPSSTVYYQDREVLRGLSGNAVRDYGLLANTRFFAKAQQQGHIVSTDVAADELNALGYELVLRHEKIPFVSYPYEWTFSQLRAAALLHLDLLLEALDEGLTMKDGYAYNVQFRGAAPVFIDIPSFEKATGGPWAGYKQFCQTFLFPLLLQAHKNVSFRPLLRGQVNGIEPRQMAALMSGRDVLRSGVFKHVRLHSAMESRFSRGGAGSQATKSELKQAGFSDELTKATVRGLRKVVGGLSWHAAESHWASYQDTSTYTDEEKSRKVEFVGAALAGQRQRLVWDLGCNDGTYSRIAAQSADYVLAVDSDELTVDILHRQLAREGNTRILPLVMDLTDASPGIGWRNQERSAFFDRDRPDVVLCLALVHHLAITANVPLPQVVDWLHGLGAKLVVEFVTHDDPMGRRLLSNKPSGLFPDYRLDVFDKLLAERFDIEQREVLPSGTRVLYSAFPRV